MQTRRYDLEEFCATWMQKADTYSAYGLASSIPKEKLFKPIVFVFISNSIQACMIPSLYSVHLFFIKNRMILE